MLSKKQNTKAKKTRCFSLKITVEDLIIKKAVGKTIAVRQFGKMEPIKHKLFTEQQFSKEAKSFDDYSLCD